MTFRLKDKVEASWPATPRAWVGDPGTDYPVSQILVAWCQDQDFGVEGYPF